MAIFNSFLLVHQRVPVLVFVLNRSWATWLRFPAHSDSLKKWVIDICDKALPFLREDLGSGRVFCWDHPCIIRLLLVGALEHLDHFSHYIGYIGNNMIIILTNSIIFQRGRYTTNQIIIYLTWIVSEFYIFFPSHQDGLKRAALKDFPCPSRALHHGCQLSHQPTSWVCP